MSVLARSITLAARCDVILLGTGGVGTALLGLLATPAAAGIRLIGVANSRQQILRAQGLPTASAAAALGQQPAHRNEDALFAGLANSDAARRVIVDATASAAVAARHATWLAAGIDVVTANKCAVDGTAQSWTALHQAAQAGCASYGDAATVGAGLPVLATLRRLRACGDPILAIEGVFSGSLSWLFNEFDGRRSFSTLLAEAHELGFTEPDPRVDLDGVDVLRKLLILARAAGQALQAGAVEQQRLLPGSLRELSPGEFLRRSRELDAPMEALRAAAAAQGKSLRFLARFDADGPARIGLRAVPPTHPAARLCGADNLFALSTRRYRAQPLVIQGPGAGVDVTAQALLGDILAVSPAGRG